MSVVSSDRHMASLLASSTGPDSILSITPTCFIFINTEESLASFWINGDGNDINVHLEFPLVFNISLNSVIEVYNPHQKQFNQHNSTEIATTESSEDGNKFTLRLLTVFLVNSDGWSCLSMIFSITVLVLERCIFSPWSFASTRIVYFWASCIEQGTAKLDIWTISVSDDLWPFDQKS